MNELDKSNGITNPLVLLQAAIERGLDPDKLGKLMDLAERWEANQAAKEFGEAITRFQSLMPVVTKGNPVFDRHGNLIYMFADFDDIMEIAQPILSQCGITVTFTTAWASGLMTTTCKVRVGIHFESTPITLGLPAIPNANDAQKAGGALSYGQRYSFKAALNIRIKGEDNDAAGQFEALQPEQIERLNELLSDCREAGSPVDMPRFWGWLECADMHEMRATDFAKAEHELTRKLAKAKKGKP